MKAGAAPPKAVSSKAGADLATINEFIELIESVARQPRQRERVLDAAGAPLSRAGLAALRIVDRHGPMPVTEVSRRLGVDQSTASRQIRPLEEANLLDREADPADRRVAWLQVTPAGVALLERVRALRLRDLEVVLRSWSRRDRAQLASLLDRFRSSMFNAALFNADDFPTQERSNAHTDL